MELDHVAHLRRLAVAIRLIDVPQAGRQRDGVLLLVAATGGEESEKDSSR